MVEREIVTQLKQFAQNCMLRIYHLKFGMQLQLSEQMKARQEVYLDYASRRLEGRPYTADPEHREIPEIVAWAD